MKRNRIMLCAALCALALAAPPAASEAAPDRYIRLHVVAASDSAWDQGVKLAVKDAVREAAAALAADCADADAAWARLREGAPLIEQAARDELAAWDGDGTLTVSTGVFPFPERAYGELTLPAGDYRAVRVTLGEGRGRNWWCVLYPSLCLPAGADPASPAVFYSSLGRWLRSLVEGWFAA